MKYLALCVLLAGCADAVAPVPPIVTVPSRATVPNPPPPPDSLGGLDCTVVVRVDTLYVELPDGSWGFFLEPVYHCKA